MGVIENKNQEIKVTNLEVRTLNYKLDEFDKTVQESQQRYQNQIKMLNAQNENYQTQL